MGQKQKLPRVEGVQVLWSTGHYDGICTGVAEHKDKKYFFRLLGGIYSNRKLRAYEMVPLSEEEFATLNASQQLFRDNIGLHCDYLPYGDFLVQQGPQKNFVDQETITQTYAKMRDISKDLLNRLEYDDPAVGYFVGGTYRLSPNHLVS